MSSKPEKFNPLYKNIIDKKIANLENVNNIYGGQTEKTLEQRQQQHEKKDNDFCNMVIEEIFSSSKESQVNQINLAETYLIKLLSTKFVLLFLHLIMHEIK